jgi:hypothetical protein
VRKKKNAISIVLKKNARGLYPKGLSGDHAIFKSKGLMAANSGRTLRFRGDPALLILLQILGRGRSDPGLAPSREPLTIFGLVYLLKIQTKDNVIVSEVSVKTSICAPRSIYLSSILKLNTETPTRIKMANVALLGSTGMVVRGPSALRITVKDPS